MRVLDRLFEPEVELRPLLRHQIDRESRELVTLTRAQYDVLDHLRGVRRASIAGPAGSGKTMLAAEKARRLVKEGFRVLLLCFNQPLSRYLASQLEPELATGYLDVRTFHQLCLDMGRAAGVLPPEPQVKEQAWWDETLPAALDAAVQTIGGEYHAVIVDEGQDFAKAWLETLPFLLVEPWEDVFYVTALVQGLTWPALAACVVLAFTPASTGQLLAGFVGVGMLLRARLFITIGQRLPLLIAGTGAIAALLVALTTELDGMTVVLVTAVPSLLAVIGCLLLAGRRRPAAPGMTRAAEIVEMTIAIAIVPLLAAVLGLFDFLRGLGG